MEGLEVEEPGQRVCVSLEAAKEQRGCEDCIYTSKELSCADIHLAPEGQGICRLFLPVGRNRM